MKLKALIAGLVGVVMVGTIGISSVSSDPQPKKLHKRTYNSDHYKNEDGTVTGSFKSKWINYMEADDSWNPIDPNFKDVGTHFEVTDAPFIAIAPKLSTGSGVFISNNRWDIVKKKKIEEEPLTMTITPVGVTEVAGHLETGDFGFGEYTYVVYEGAYPELNADLIYWVDKGRDTRLKKMVRFNSNPNLTEDIEMEFVFEFSDKVKIKNNGKKWNQEGDLKTKKAISVRSDKVSDDSARGIGLKKAYIWSDWNERVEVEVDLKKNGNSYPYSKALTKDYFDTLELVYPVFTDASMAFNPDADGAGGATTTDGYAGFAPGDDTWANIRGGAGDHSDDSGVNSHFVALQAGSVTPKWINMQTGIYLFDVSAIGGGTASAADFKIYVTAHNQDDFGESVGLVGSAPNTDTAIINGDYATITTTRYATDLVIADLNDTQYNTWTVNGTGITFIQTAMDGDGIVKFGTDTAARIDNAEPGWGNAFDESRATGNFADNGSNEPTLDVTYDAPDEGGAEFFMFF